MAAGSKPDRAEKPAPEPEPEPAKVLGVAAESGDPRVQDLLARREILARNGLDVAGVNEQLAALGVA